MIRRAVCFVCIVLLAGCAESQRSVERSMAGTIDWRLDLVAHGEVVPRLSGKWTICEGRIGKSAIGGHGPSRGLVYKVGQMTLSRDGYGQPSLSAVVSILDVAGSPVRTQEVALKVNGQGPALCQVWDDADGTLVLTVVVSTPKEGR